MEPAVIQNFEISVIIPVYNAAPFIAEALQSVLEQPEVKEVILVEDCSTDDSLAVCQRLVAEHPQVRLFQHAGGVNRGAGPSRNLGILQSACPYLAFLDADDLYLPSRFSVSQKIFKENADCDGVYDAVGMFSQDLASLERWRKHSIASEGVTCMQPGINPRELFSALMKSGRGHIHLNGLLIRRRILTHAGLMDDSIADILGEDTDWIARLSAVGNLYAGSLSVPTAMRRVHMQNQVSAPRSSQSILRDRKRLWVATYQWVRKNASPEQRNLAFRRLSLEFTGFPEEQSNLQKISRLTRLPFRVPAALLEPHYYRTIAETAWAVIRNDWLKLK